MRFVFWHTDFVQILRGTGGRERWGEGGRAGGGRFGDRRSGGGGKKGNRLDDKVDVLDKKSAFSHAVTGLGLQGLGA